MNRPVKAKKSITQPETTFQAIENIAAHMTDNFDANVEIAVDPTELGATLHHPPRNLFDITGIQEHQPQIEETLKNLEEPAVVPEAEAVVPREVPLTTEETNKRKEKPTAISLALKKSTKKLRVVLKRKLIIDEVKEIPDAIISKRIKHSSEIQQSDIDRVTILNKLPTCDLLRTNNRDMRKCKLLTF